MNHFLYKLNPPRSTFPGDMTPAEAQLMREHVGYWAGHMKQGRVIAFGPVADPKGSYGVGIIQLEDGQDAHALAAQDPVIVAGVGFGFEVHPMPRLVVAPTSGRGEGLAENLIHRLIPHQGCAITRTPEGIEICGSAMNWVMSAGVVPFTCRPPFLFRVVGKTDSTNLRMHFHRGELIFNWECSVRELRVHDPATAEQHSLKDKGFISTTDWHEILWEIRLDRMRVLVDGEVRYEGTGDYAGIESTPSVGPCFGSTVSLRECSITPLP